MRHIDRLPIPNILDINGAEWTRIFIASGRARPHSGQYGHAEVRALLNAMSGHKCFYCERLLKDIPNEVDHYIEVAEYKHLAYLWENLYLACDNCNGKISNRLLPVLDTLDPCAHSDAEIELCLTFNDELIREFDDSEMGRQKIRKYKLDSLVSDFQRSKALNSFKDVLIAIQQAQIGDGGRPMTAEELERLRSFASRGQQFSLMFKLKLRSHGLL